MSLFRAWCVDCAGEPPAEPNVEHVVAPDAAAKLFARRHADLEDGDSLRIDILDEFGVLYKFVVDAEMGWYFTATAVKEG